MAKEKIGSVDLAEYDVLVATLIEARLEKGLSQRAVAKLLDEDKTYVQRVEQAERRIDVVEFLLLARAIGVDPKQLFNQFVDRIAPK